MADNELLWTLRINGTDVGIKSMNDLTSSTKILTAQFNAATTQAERMAIALQLRKVPEIKSAFMGVNTTLQGTQTASANASMALLNLNYVVRDSPYFFNNFALGLLAVGNNLNPLIDSFNRLRAEAVEKNISTFALLKNAMIGGAGISIAFSVLVTAIQSYVFATQSAKRATKELKEEFEGLDVEFVKFIEQQRILTSDPSAMGTIFGSAEEYYKAKQWVYLFDEMNKTFSESAKVKLQAQLADAEFIKGTYAEGTPLFEWAKGRITVLKDLLKVYEDIKPKGEKDKKFGIYSIFFPEMFPITGWITEFEVQMKRLQKAFQDADIGSGVGNRLWSKYKINWIERLKRETDELAKATEEKTKQMMSAMRELASVAGNAISNAFLSGKNAIDAATQALIQFIVQLLVVQSLMGVLSVISGGTFGAGFFTGGLAFLAKNSPSPSPNMLNKGATIRVEGNLRAEGNEFIAGFNKSVNIYNQNVKGSSLGR